MARADGWWWWWYRWLMVIPMTDGDADDWWWCRWLMQTYIGSGEEGLLPGDSQPNMFYAPQPNPYILFCVPAIGYNEEWSLRNGPWWQNWIFRWLTCFTSKQSNLIGIEVSGYLSLEITRPGRGCIPYIVHGRYPCRHRHLQRISGPSVFHAVPVWKSQLLYMDYIWITYGYGRHEMLQLIFPVGRG